MILLVMCCRHSSVEWDAIAIFWSIWWKIQWPIFSCLFTDKTLHLSIRCLVYCLTPPKIDHARHSALPEQGTFDLDSTVQYHCHTGYVTAGFPRAKCLAIGKIFPLIFTLWLRRIIKIPLFNQDGQASWYGPDIQCERKCFRILRTPNSNFIVR